MEILLRRDQKSGMMGMGSITFALEVRARLTPAEQQNITKYKLGKTVLYTKAEMVDPGRGLLGLASRLAFKAMNISVTVDDLAGGKRIECKDILEMLTAGKSKIRRNVAQRYNDKGPFLQTCVR